MRSRARSSDEMDRLVPKLDIQSEREGKTSTSTIKKGWQVRGIPGSEWLFALLDGTHASRTGKEGERVVSGLVPGLFKMHRFNVGG